MYYMAGGLGEKAVWLLCEVGGQDDIPQIVVWQKDVEGRGKAQMIDISLRYQCLNVIGFYEEAQTEDEIRHCP